MNQLETGREKSNQSRHNRLHVNSVHKNNIDKRPPNKSKVECEKCAYSDHLTRRMLVKSTKLRANQLMDFIERNGKIRYEMKSMLNGDS